MGIFSEKDEDLVNSNWNFIVPRQDSFLPPWREGDAQYHDPGEHTTQLKRPPNKIEYLQDLQLKRKIIDCLSHDSLVDEGKIEVKVRDGEVTLAGSVPSHWLKLQVEAWVEQIVGVHKVNNNIVIDQFPEGH